jgi:iron complex transport system substrate-binding protein
MVAALGAAIGPPPRPAVPGLVGVSHACDYPPAVTALPRVTTAAVDLTQSSGDIDRAVRKSVAAGVAPVSVDERAIDALHPDLIITQAVCEVCAIGPGVLDRVLAALPAPPRMLALHAHTLEGVWRDLRAVGAAIQLADEAEEVLAGLQYQLNRVRERSARAKDDPPRTIVLEWLDPPYVAGHWVPELVSVAGGQDVGNAPGQPSRVRPWADLIALDPDRLIVALCGFDVDRARRDVASLHGRDARRLLSRGVEFLDGNAYTSRPGPRLVEAAERLAALLGP